MSPQPTETSIADTFGEVLIGVVFAAVFYGITAVQTFTYYDRAGRDGWVLKTLVAFVFVVDTAHMGLIVHSVWFYLVDSFGRPENLARVTWSIAVQVVPSSVVATTVQCFFAHRVWALSRQLWLVVLIVVTAFAHNAFDFFFVVRTLQRPHWVDIPRVTWSTSTSLGSSIASDILIAVSLCYYLFNSKSGMAHTDSLINKLILYTVTTGLLTTIFSLATLILFAVSPSFLSDMIYFSIAKFYTNSLLASLNSRDKMRSMFERSGTTSNSFRLAQTTAHSIHFSDPRGQRTRIGCDAGAGAVQRPPEIHVSVARHVARDGAPRGADRTDDEESQDLFDKSYAFT